MFPTVCRARWPGSGQALVMRGNWQGDNAVEFIIFREHLKFRFGLTTVSNDYKYYCEVVRWYSVQLVCITGYSIIGLIFASKPGEMMPYLYCSNVELNTNARLFVHKGQSERLHRKPYIGSSWPWYGCQTRTSWTSRHDHHWHIYSFYVTLFSSIKAPQPEPPQELWN